MKAFVGLLVLWELLGGETEVGGCDEQEAKAHCVVVSASVTFRICSKPRM